MKLSFFNGVMLYILGAIIIICAICFQTEHNHSLEFAEPISVYITNVEKHKFLDNDLDARYDYTAYGTYSYNGIKYENQELNIFESKMRKGKTVTLYVDIRNPELFIFHSKISIRAISFFIMGLALFFGGSILLFFPLELFSKNRGLKTKGLKKNLEIISLYPDEDDTFFGESNFLICEVPNEYKWYLNEIKSYSSSHKFDESYIGKMVTVYFDCHDCKNYYIDTKTIKNKGV